MRRRVPPARAASARRSCSSFPGIRCRAFARTISSPVARFACAAAATAIGRIAAVRAKVARKIVSAIGRVDYCRVRIVDGAVDPIALSGASMLSSTTRADGFVIVPAESEGYGPETEVAVYLYDEFPQQTP
jgi:molybdopterin biosynthesis enzyme